MPINPLGAVLIFDGDNPRTFTARARTAISGGDLVVSSGAATNFSSGADSFATTDLVMDIVHGADFCNGMALNTVGSNSNVTVATRGAFIMRSAGVISGGNTVFPFSGTTQGVKASSITLSHSGTAIGRAMSAAGSGTNRYLLVDLQV